MEQIAAKTAHVKNFEELQQLETKAREWEQSIRYAQSLQQSILPNERLFFNTFRDAFVIFNPKDLLSGDFYWMNQFGADIYFAVADCTGHGVPGALLNIAGNTLLKQIIQREGVADPAEIIQLLDEELIALFNDNNTKGETYDGMDISFCKFNLEKKEGSFCGAGRPLLLCRDEELIEFKKGASAVGYTGLGEKEFHTVQFDLKQGDRFYLFSDGYTDQFGGDNIKKFNRKRFRNLLLSIQDKPMSHQKKELSLTFNNWKGKHEQIDDVCILGVEI